MTDPEKLRSKGIGLPDGVLELLTLHHDSFFAAAKFAQRTEQPVPCDTRAWSQIVISTLTGIPGLARKKGADLKDGSDVKAANVWLAIDTPRFNGCIKAGGKGGMRTLDRMPHLFLVLWDYLSDEIAEAHEEESQKLKRCRVWIVQPETDATFRAICEKWYKKHGDATDNFQLHPPRNTEGNVITNTCGNLVYPLFFRAEWNGSQYKAIEYHPDLLLGGACKLAGK